MRIACLVAVAVIGSAASARAEDGFKPLFNGKDLTGWTTYLGDSSVSPDAVWSVKDGVIVCKGKPAGYLITKEEFGDYTLRFEWRFPPDSKGGNSGCLLHVQPPDKIWPKSVEAQLQSGRAGDFWLIDAKLDVDEARRDPNVSRHYIRIGESWAKQDAKDKKGRDVFRLNGKNFEKPFGEWNKYEITTNNGNITLKVNGVVVNEGKNGELKKGKILFQSEGAEIQFRNIEIKSK